MGQVIQARDISLEEIQSQFDLRLTSQKTFCPCIVCRLTDANLYLSSLSKNRNVLMRDRLHCQLSENMNRSTY